MKLGTGHTPQQCSNAYRNQKGNASPLKSSEQTAVPQKPRASVTSLKQTEKGKSKPGPATEEVTGVSSKDEFEGGTSHCGRNLRKSRRRRVKMDTMTSEDSEAESNHRSQPTKPRPAPDRKEKMEKQKVSENSVLDMSPSIRPSGQPRREEERARRTHHGVQTLREGDGSEILGDEEQIRREKTSKRPALAMDSSDSLYGNSERLPGKMSDADLRHLRQ